MAKTYFLAVDKIGERYQGHDDGNFALNSEKVDILWRSSGVKGDALKYFDTQDRKDRSGFLRYKTPPTIKGSNYYSCWKTENGQLQPPEGLNELFAARKKEDDVVALRRFRIGLSHQYGETYNIQYGETYNIWSDSEGREYIIFAVDGERLRTKDLEGRVNLAYYGGSEGAYIKPLWSDEMLVRTRLIPVDRIRNKVFNTAAELVFESHQVGQQSMPVERALDVFSSNATLSDDVCKERVRNYIEAAELREVLKRERKVKTGLLRSETVHEIVPVYAVESLEVPTHTLCAVVRGPLHFKVGEALQRELR